jgi:hypothetical protein
MSKKKNPTPASLRQCYFVPVDGFVEGRGFRASVVTENTAGHQPTGTWPNDGTGVMPYFWGPSLEEAEAAAARANQNLGLTKTDVASIIASSMAAQMRAEKGKRR